MGDASKNRDVGGEVSRLVEQAKELQDSTAALISRTSHEEDALCLLVASLNPHVSSLRNTQHANRLEVELIRSKYILSKGDATAFLPSKSHGRFLRMFLGPINVRTDRKDVQLKVKEEYNNFRVQFQVQNVKTFYALPWADREEGWA